LESELIRRFSRCKKENLYE